MQQYCLDTDVFIQAKNGPYGFDIVPAFWDWLDQKVVEGILFSSTEVYKELSRGEDELAAWVKDRRKTNFFIEPDSSVQKIFKDIANYVNDNYTTPQAQFFLDGADPWVIAHGKAKNAIVVTHEVLAAYNSKKVKIPNICRLFDVKYINTYQLLRNLKATFGLM